MAISLSLTRHYNNTIGLPGDIGAVAARLAKLEATGASKNQKDWLETCAAKKAEWAAYKHETLCVPAAAR